MSRPVSAPPLDAPGPAQLEATDSILPFQIEGVGLRGRAVRLGPALGTILGCHAYPEPVAMLLGETLALAALLAGALKYDGVFTLQTKGDGPVRLMVADVTSAGDLRGFAQFDAAAVAAALDQGRVVDAPVPRLLGAGYLAFTVDQGAHTDRYQGIVALEGPTLAECVHHYFRQSEQIEAGIRLACARGGDGVWRAGALMLQRLPPGGGVAESGLLSTLDSETADEDWRRALVLLASARRAELTDPDLPAADLLYRLFHEDGVRVWPVEPLRARCRCSRPRLLGVLRTIPRAELMAVAVNGVIEVTCEFCNTQYMFGDADFDADRTPPPST